MPLFITVMADAPGLSSATGTSSLVDVVGSRQLSELGKSGD